jgi:ubiquinone/menaquinone biosynthesis C-methylase UbiE
MSITLTPAGTTPRLRCVDCCAVLEAPACAEVGCAACGRTYPAEEGVLVALGELHGNNRIAANFYNSDRWRRFRIWENLFLKTFGGLPAARLQVLRHLRPLTEGSLLEVGIGDGENVALLPHGWRVSGVDIARRPLLACRKRHASRGLWLALAEGERLPFADRSFDAVLCVGGFNFFSDPLKAFHEMTRVTRPLGRVVVADELPDLFRWGWGHLLGWPAFDEWLMKRFWLGPEFTAMVLANHFEAQVVARTVSASFRVHSIWRGYGYCLAGWVPRTAQGGSP